MSAERRAAADAPSRPDIDPPMDPPVDRLGRTLDEREAWLDAFEQQAIPAMLARVKRYALRRVRMVANAGGEGGDGAASELVQNALGDTFAGVLRWDPQREPLETHLLGVVQWRSRDQRRQRRAARVVSMDEDTTTRERAARFVDATASPGALADASLSSSRIVAIHELAASDVSVRAIVDAFADGAGKRSEVLARTGMTENDYNAARLRMIRAAREARHASANRARKGGHG